jgi:hypothetical protein
MVPTTMTRITASMTAFCDILSVFLNKQVAEKLGHMSFRIHTGCVSLALNAVGGRFGAPEAVLLTGRHLDLRKKRRKEEGGFWGGASPQI